MSFVNGIREAARAFHEETGSHLDMIILGDREMYALVSELGDESFSLVEIDDTVVTTRGRLLR